MLTLFSLFALSIIGVLLMLSSLFINFKRLDAARFHRYSPTLSVLFFVSMTANALFINFVALFSPEALHIQSVKVGIGLTLLLTYLFAMILILAFFKPIVLDKWIFLLTGKTEIQEEVEEKEPEDRTSSYWLEDEKALRIKEKVDDYLAEEKPYLAQGFCVADLAEAIEVPRHQLSACFTQAYGINFNELINTMRVEYALRHVEAEKWENYTVEGMAHHLGFGSRSTFTHAFKKIMNMTPSKYRKQREKTPAFNVPSPVKGFRRQDGLNSFVETG